MIHIYIYAYVYLYMCIYIHIFASIFTKWKIFYQCLLIPESGKAELISFIPLYFCFYFQVLKIISPIHFTSKIRMNVNDLEYFQIEKKKIKQRNWKVRLSPQTGKKCSNFLYLSTYLTLFPQSGKHFNVAIYFHKIAKKFRNFLYFFIGISFRFHDVDYISQMRFISTKWKIFH